MHYLFIALFILFGTHILAAPTEDGSFGKSDTRSGNIVVKRLDGYQGYQTASDDIERIALKAHNDVRGAYGLAPLEWNDDLGLSAQNDVDQCLSGGHADESYGENVAVGSFNMKEAVSARTKKSADHYKGVFSKGAGHYAQPTWKTANKVGCASGQCGGTSLIICKYYPAGNMPGEYNGNIPHQ